MMLAVLALTVLSAPPAAALQEEGVRWARVSAETTAARAFYDARAAEVAKLAKGTPLRVVAEMTPWVRVEAPAGYDTWIHGDYADFRGVEGKPANARVRVRPLPSTGSESHPMGHYPADGVLLRIGSDGDWVQVRAPESVSAWVLAADLSIVDAEPEGWEADWKDWAKRRAPRTQAPPPAEEVVPPAEPVGEAPPQGGTPAGEPGAREAAPVSAAGAGAGDPAEAAAVAPLPDAAAIAEDPRAAMAVVQERLDVLYKRMAADREHWDRPLLDGLEAAASEIVWRTQDARTLDLGRAALRRIDVLRRAYLDALGRQVRQAEGRGDEEVAALLARRLQRATAPPPAAEAPPVVVGMVVFRAEPHSGRPWAVERLGYSATVHCYDGRYRLEDYRDREVVLRGAWRVEGEGEQQRRVFAVESLRVLPRIGG